MDKKKTGALIREARIKKNYTQSELGDLIGVSNKAVSRWENGDSFPDIGVLENLSNVLEIRLQDIITGDVKKDEEDAITEVVRVATFQQKEQKRKLIRYSLFIVFFLYFIYFGYLALGGNGVSSFKRTVVFYEISIAVLYLLMIVVFNKKGNVGKDNSVFPRIIKVVSVVSLLWGIIVTWLTMYMVTSGNVPFGMQLSSIGPLVNCQLIVLFLINMVIIGLSIYRYEAKDVTFEWENYVSAAVVHIAILYGLWLHDMSSIEAAIESITSITLIVVILLILSLIVLLLKKRKCNYTKNI